MNAPGVADGGPQIWFGDSPYIVLGHVTAGSEVTVATAQARIYCPDSRVRVKVSLLFVADDPTDPDPILGWGATLYIGEEELDRSIGRVLICTDVLRDSAGNVVHQSAPLTIPEDAGLAGFTQEFVTAADSLRVIFSPGAAVRNGQISGNWLLQVRYQPDGQRLCPSDWDYVKRKCHATLLGSPANL